MIDGEMFYLNHFISERGLFKETHNYHIAFNVPEYEFPPKIPVIALINLFNHHFEPYHNSNQSLLNPQYDNEIIT